MSEFCLYFLGACFVFSHCTLFVPSPPETRPSTPDSATLAVAEAAWVRGLNQHIQSDGRVDFEAITANRTDLDIFGGFVW